MKSWTPRLFEVKSNLFSIKLMKKSVALLSALLLGLPVLAGAYDGETDFEGRAWYGGRRGGEQFGGLVGSLTPLYYRPTQRYYGNGFTVNYRYVPVYDTDGPRTVSVTGASNFRTEAFRMNTQDAQSWGAYSPRLTVRDPKSAAPRTAVTSIVRKKTTGKIPSKAAAETAPPIVPSATEATSPEAGTVTPVPATTPNNP